MAGTFRNLNAFAEVSRAGYHYKTFLPGAAGVAVGESTAANDSIAGTLDGELAETTWFACAWPASYSIAGNRTFFVNQTGDVVGKDDATMSGGAAITTATAGSAFVLGSGLTKITGYVAVGTTDADGFLWKRVD